MRGGEENGTAGASGAPVAGLDLPVELHVLRVHGLAAGMARQVVVEESAADGDLAAGVGQRS